MGGINIIGRSSAGELTSLQLSQPLLLLYFPAAHCIGLESGRDEMGPLGRRTRRWPSGSFPP